MNPVTYDNRMATLTSYAALLGLDLVGEVRAVPNDPPQVLIGKSGRWKCPHCREKQDQLVLVEVGGSYQHNADAEVLRAVLDEGGPMEPADAQWSARVREHSTDTDTVAYRCPACQGFVAPANPLVWL